MDLKKVENNIYAKNNNKKGMKEHNSHMHLKDRNFFEKFSSFSDNILGL